MGERITCEDGDLLSQHLCFRNCKSTAEVSTAPALHTYAHSSCLLSPFCPDERRSVGVRHFLGHCNLNWITSNSFSVFPVTSQHLPFAGGPGESSGGLSFSHLLVQGCCLIAQATLVIEIPHNWALCSTKNCELGPCERFKRSSSIITEIPENNYHACIGKWLLSERELCRMYTTCVHTELGSWHSKR